MAPVKPQIWLDANILMDIQSFVEKKGADAARALGAVFEPKIRSLAAGGHELLITQKVRLEFFRGVRAQTADDFLSKYGIVYDSQGTMIKESQIDAWTREGTRNGLSQADARVIAEVKAGAVMRRIRNPVYLTRDSKAIPAMQRRGVNATELNATTQIPADPAGLPDPAWVPPELPTSPRTQIPADSPPPMPEVPLPKGPGTGSVRVYLNMAKNLARASLEAAFSAESIAAMIPMLVLQYSDIVAAQEATLNIMIKFLKEGFAKGVAAGAMGWSEQEVASEAMNRVTNFRVQGLADPAGNLTMGYILKVAEACENYAVGVGYYFSSSKSLQWKKEILDKGFDLLKQYGYTYFGQDERVLYQYDFISKLAWALRRTTDPAVEQALRIHTEYAHPLLRAVLMGPVASYVSS
jgi:hypothetical protein